MVPARPPCPVHLSNLDLPLHGLEAAFQLAVFILNTDVLKDVKHVVCRLAAQLPVLGLQLQTLLKRGGLEVERNKNGDGGRYDMWRLRRGGKRKGGRKDRQKRWKWKMCRSERDWENCIFV